MLKNASMKSCFVKCSLQPLYDDVQLLMTIFSHISLCHRFRDMNMIVDGLSKDGLGLDRETLIISLLQDGHTT